MIKLKIYKCCQCHKAFTQKFSFDLHVKEEHTNQAQYLYLCHICGELCDEKHCLTKHNKPEIEENQIEDLYLCHICGQFVNKTHANCKPTQIYQKLSKNDKTQPNEIQKIKKKVSCPICQNTFATKTNLNKHIRVIHQKIKNFQCDICQKRLSTNAHLVQHVNSTHKKIKYNCPKCNKVFSSKSALKHHIENLHNKIKTILCNECHQLFRLHREFKLHWLLHHNQSHLLQFHKKVTIFTCKTCNKGFNSSSNLSRHVLLVHQKTKKFWM